MLEVVILLVGHELRIVADKGLELGNIKNSERNAVQGICHAREWLDAHAPACRVLGDLRCVCMFP